MNSAICCACSGVTKDTVDVFFVFGCLKVDVIFASCDTCPLCECILVCFYYYFYFVLQIIDFWFQGFFRILYKKCKIIFLPTLHPDIALLKYLSNWFNDVQIANLSDTVL